MMTNPPIMWSANEGASPQLPGQQPEIPDIPPATVPERQPDIHPDPLGPDIPDVPDPAPDVPQPEHTPPQPLNLCPPAL